MTVITGSQSALRISDIDMMRSYYQGVQGGVLKMGAEVEYALGSRSDLAVPTRAQNAQLFETLTAQGWGARHEPPTSACEIASPPYALSEVKALLSHVNHATQALHKTALDQGLFLSPFGHFPHIPLEALQVIEFERYQTFFDPPREDMIEVFRFFNSCMNVQISLGYRDPDHLLKIIRMATALHPIIFLSTDSSCGFAEGQAITHAHNIWQKNKLGVNTGIPDFYYTAKTGADLVDAHIDFTLNHRHIFAAFDQNNQLKRLPKGQWCSFNQLEALGYGPQNMTNYLQAQSESWRMACNISTIMDEKGQLTNHRAEIGAFQNGLLHQRASAIILGYLIGFDEIFYEKTQALLAEFAIDLNDLAQSKPALEHNFDVACSHNNHYHDLAFSTGTLKDFVLPFADIIEERAAHHGLEQESAPLIHILRTGRPDWLVHRQALPDLESTITYLRDFPARAQDNLDWISADFCADQLFKRASTQSKSLASKESL